MFSYSVVEGALAVFFQIRPQGQPALRSRIRHLQRLGFNPTNVGNTKRTEYTKYDVYDLALALSLAEFGADPSQILASGVQNLIRDFDKANVWVKEEWACAYFPQYFSTGKSELKFQKVKDLKKLITSQPRIAIINVADLINNIDDALA